MAPINLPDGTEVSEVILPDGATASEVIAPDGSTVFGGIPDSVEYQFVASSTSSGSDWTSEDGSLTLSVEGSPTILSGDLAGEDVLDYDGTNDAHTTTNISLSQPTAIVAVYRKDATTNNAEMALGGSRSNSRHLLTPDISSNDIYGINAGSGVDGSGSDNSYAIHSGYFDGTNSETRLNGSTDTSGDAGTNDLTDLSVAKWVEFGSYLDMSIAEFWILNDPSLQDVKDSEATLNDKYAIY